MKGLILALVLGSGTLFASNDTVQDFAINTCDQFVEKIGFGHKMNGFREITEEMQELINYRIDLIQSYDFENMTDEEIKAAKEEIRLLIEAKAQELGIELPEKRLSFGYSEEHKELKEYSIELYKSYDFDNMTEEEILAAKEEIRLLVEAKAKELGIELPGKRFGFGYSEELKELKEYSVELYKNYNFKNMTEEEIKVIKEEIYELIKAKAQELGIDFNDDLNGKGFKGKRHMSRFKGNHRHGRIGK